MLDHFSKHPYSSAYLCSVLLDAKECHHKKRVKILARVQSILTLVRSYMGDDKNSKRDTYRNSVSLWYHRIKALVHSIEVAAEGDKDLISMIDVSVKQLISDKEETIEEVIEAARSVVT